MAAPRRASATFDEALSAVLPSAPQLGDGELVAPGGRPARAVVARAPCRWPRGQLRPRVAPRGAPSTATVVILIVSIAGPSSGPRWPKLGARHDVRKFVFARFPFTLVMATIGAFADGRRRSPWASNSVTDEARLGAALEHPRRHRVPKQGTRALLLDPRGLHVVACDLAHGSLAPRRPAPRGGGGGVELAAASWVVESSFPRVRSPRQSNDGSVADQLLSSWRYA